jgi:hypothetical protein
VAPCGQWRRRVLQRGAEARSRGHEMRSIPLPPLLPARAGDTAGAAAAPVHDGIGQSGSNGSGRVEFDETVGLLASLTTFQSSSNEASLPAGSQRREQNDPLALPGHPAPAPAAAAAAAAAAQTGAAAAAAADAPRASTVLAKPGMQLQLSAVAPQRHRVGGSSNGRSSSALGDDGGSSSSSSSSSDSDDSDDGSGSSDEESSDSSDWAMSEEERGIWVKAVDPNRPKRPQSAFILFSVEQQRVLRKQATTARSTGSIQKQIGAAWQTMVCYPPSRV